jgi:hypothetical protein
VAARGRGLTFLTDQDARPVGSAHPQTHLWDNGADAVTELARVLAVRRAALQRLGENAVRRGAPLATIEETLVPLYLHHRYQTEAAVKLVGGVTYSYALRGDGQPPPTPVPAAAQLAALDAVLGTLDPAALTLPRGLLAAIPPRPYTFDAHRELFDRWTGLTFDAVSPAAAAAGMSVGCCSTRSGRRASSSSTRSTPRCRASRPWSTGWSPARSDHGPPTGTTRRSSG